MFSKSDLSLHSSLNKQTAIIILSNIVVYFDFLIYLYLADVLSAVFFPSTNDPLLAKIQILGLFAIGYIARPVGGLLIGRFGDVNGRKPAYKVTISIMLFTSIIAVLLPTYAQVGILAPILFIIVRLIQGMGFAAHSVLGWVFISEHAPKKNIGLYVSAVSASFLASILFASYSFNVIFATFSPEALISYGWRIIFFISSLFSLVTLFLIRYLDETPFYKSLQSSNSLKAKQLPKFSDIKLSYNRFHAIFLTILFSFQVSSFAIVVALLLPDLIHLKFFVDAAYLNIANIIGVMFFILGVIFYGILADRGHVGQSLMYGSIFVITQALVFYFTLDRFGTDYILITYAMLGFSSGVIALAPIIMLQLFPTKERLATVGVIYNLIYAITGGLLPVLLIYFTNIITLSPALYIVFVGFVGLITGQYIYRSPKYCNINSHQLDNYDSKINKA